ncbi:Lateral organ boundary protein [Theobroma cacao]|uniref:LOB domain-containing protein 41, putative n=1 Tax=Theobroma cacao TaxID=3641 RepID=A0A061G1V5_THECC|nr:LOB domain-containing protein 41, putative [Theobroma cacao]WRX18472.1 Lateral organ boundary protein [Theobroma cacao]
MRMSCNGCRVLRKGCTESCSIRPCLQWIATAQSQANATLFLAKFYGRAGLINLINAGPENLRPGIFKSLLYEACGRIVNPVHGSVGLMWSGSWHLCEAAVDAVLRGSPINKVSSELSDSSPHLKSSCDIRHVSKEKNSDDGLRKIKSRGRFKRSAWKPKAQVEKEVCHESVSHESGLSQRRSPGGDGAEGDTVSVETVEASLAKADELADGSDLELDLTLGFEPSPRKRANSINGCDDATCGVQLDLGQGSC